MKVTILIPARNEENTIGNVIEKAQKWLEKNKIQGEIIVANNASTDKTKEFAIKYDVKIIDISNIGYGNALREGIKHADGDYIIMGDADESYNFLEISEFINKLEDGYDLVIGNRYYRMEKGAMKWTHKYIGTPILTKIVNKKYGLNLKDINCGLRGFKKDKILELGLKSKGMEFASEMIIKAKQANLRITEIPIDFYKDKRNKKSNLKPVKDGIEHLKLILKM